ncbi:MAG: YigZ family protein [Cyclobacteriaceae bacterium]|nr:YigZ family protein [Cyclobacteriaceae bacterium]
MAYPFSFLTITGSAESLFKDTGSKFFSYAFPVQDEEEVKQHLVTLRKKYFDATHHCYGYVLGADGSKFRANDDGEPNHSAGDPILGQLRSRNLTNALVVVVRYFGGTKLGVSGLIHAYRESAALALNQCTIVEKDVTEKILLLYDYAATPEVMRLLKDFGMTIEEQDFQDRCSLLASVRKKVFPELIEKIELLIALGHPMEIATPPLSQSPHD